MDFLAIASDIAVVLKVQCVAEKGSTQKCRNWFLLITIWPSFSSRLSCTWFPAQREMEDTTRQWKQKSREDFFINFFVPSSQPFIETLSSVTDEKKRGHAAESLQSISVKLWTCLYLSWDGLKLWNSFLRLNSQSRKTCWLHLTRLRIDIIITSRPIWCPNLIACLSTKTKRKTKIKTKAVVHSCMFWNKAVTN